MALCVLDQYPSGVALHEELLTALGTGYDSPHAGKSWCNIIRLADVLQQVAWAARNEKSTP